MFSARTRPPRRLWLAASALLLAPLAARAQTESEITVAGPTGPLKGTQTDTGNGAPLLLLIPGSGPTDRDGNNRLGVTGGPYRQLAQALAARGVSTLRIDKRGMFGSQGAGDPNAVTIAGYADDVRAWAADARKRTGRQCIWMGGHSEGGLVALVVAQQPDGLCGLVLIAAPGRPLGTILREQLRGNPALEPIIAPAFAAIDALEAGRRVDPATLPSPLPLLFAAQVQDFLIEAMRHDPAKLAAATKLPILVVQGDRDIQVQVGDADRLARAAPTATRTVIPGMTHVLRLAASDTPAASLVTYRDASLPVAPDLIRAISDFVNVRPAPRPAAARGAARP